MSDKWRVGRKVGRTIYLQHGAEPSDSDPLIGVMDSPQLARDAVDSVNGAPRRRPRGAVVNLFHIHRWRVVAAQHYIDTSWDCKVRSTLVLFRCSCGAVKSDSAVGTWTVEQLRGETS